jgi:co-chaperonin GroES (HSP10)
MPETKIIFPLRDNAFILRDDSEELFAGTVIYKPELYRRKQACGEVVALGGDCTNLVIGDKVIFRDRMSRLIDFQSQELVVCKEEEILCIINED